MYFNYLYFQPLTFWSVTGLFVCPLFLWSYIKYKPLICENSQVEANVFFQKGLRGAERLPLWRNRSTFLFPVLKARQIPIFFIITICAISLLSQPPLVQTISYTSHSGSWSNISNFPHILRVIQGKFDSAWIGNTDPSFLPATVIAVSNGPSKDRMAILPPPKLAC